MKVAIIHYNAGNVQSVLYAMERLKIKATLTADHDEIRKAEKVIFPGVGEANTTMTYLKKHGLDYLIRSLQQPVLGICLGMQLLCEYSEENDTPCLGIFPHQVKLFLPKNGEKVPHMGWNQLNPIANSWVPPSTQNEFVYFVHSYYVEDGPYTTATTDYIHPFSACMKKDNFYATQFHPEKSGPVGASILQAFLNL